MSQAGGRATARRHIAVGIRRALFRFRRELIDRALPMRIRESRDAILSRLVRAKPQLHRNYFAHPKLRPRALHCQSNGYILIRGECGHCENDREEDSQGSSAMRTRSATRMACKNRIMSQLMSSSYHANPCRAEVG